MKNKQNISAGVLALCLTALISALPAAAQSGPANDSSETGAAMEQQPSRAQQLMGDIAPQLADLTDNVLYGQVWSRPGLSPRDRSLVTISSLIAMDRPDQLRSHIRLALQNGVTEAEISEVITHMAFYSGWPTAVTAVGIARDVFNEDQTSGTTSARGADIVINRRGSEPGVAGSSEYFSGDVLVESRFRGTGEARVSGGTVVFSAGARTNWHTHPLGQTLIVTDGVGRVQAWDGEVMEIRPGDTVWIPAGVKHWHGASERSGLTHIAIAETQNGKSVDWLEPVSE